MTPTIYRIEFPDGQFYIGSTCNFSARRRTHLRDGRMKRAVNQRLQAAFDAHQVCGIYPVASGMSRETLHLLEQAVIEQEAPTLNVNLRPTPIPSPTQLGEAKVARRYGVSPNLYYVRRSLGWSLYEALNLKPRPPERRPKVKQRIISAGGKTMPLNAWAKHLGVSPGVIHARLSSGWSEAEAVGVERRQVEIEREQRRAEAQARKRPRVQYSVGGHTGTMAELCRVFGANYARADSRRKLGWPIESWFRGKADAPVFKSDDELDMVDERLFDLYAHIAPS